MVELKTPGEIDAMREAGRVVARMLEAARAASTLGARLVDLDAAAHEVLREAGATSPFLNYHPHFAPTPFPAVLCLSVNDAVVHGIPNDYRLADGDLVSVDAGAILDGWAGDAAVSYVVGEARPEDEQLIETTRLALEAGIDAARPGGRLEDIGAAVSGIARPAGYGQLESFGGHGVGRTMHEGPFVPNEGRRGRGMKLKPGLVIAIEPMLHAGGQDEYRADPDGWTLRTADGSRAAHWEHTVAVTEDGPRVLTLL